MALEVVGLSEWEWVDSGAHCSSVFLGTLSGLGCLCQRSPGGAVVVVAAVVAETWRTGSEWVTWRWHGDADCRRLDDSAGCSGGGGCVAMSWSRRTAAVVVGVVVVVAGGGCCC